MPTNSGFLRIPLAFDSGVKSVNLMKTPNNLLVYYPVNKESKRAVKLACSNNSYKSTCYTKQLTGAVYCNPPCSDVCPTLYTPPFQACCNGYVYEPSTATCSNGCVYWNDGDNICDCEQS
jgi:hypothetical protein